MFSVCNQQGYIFIILQQLAPDMGMTPLDEPSQIKTSCDEEAAEIVSRISVSIISEQVITHNIVIVNWMQN